MLWIPLTLLSAFSLSTADALTKRALSSADVYAVAWLRNLLALPFLLAALLFVPVPKLDFTFFAAYAAGLPLEVAATLLYIKAIEVSPLSLTMPFMALTPFYLLATSFVILGEVPTPAGAAGVCLLGAGAYLLNAHTLREGGLLAPFRAIYREKGSLMMMGVAAIYALTSDLGKLAINHSSPVFYGASYFAGFCVLFTPLALKFSRRPMPSVRESLTRYVPIGAALAAMILFHVVAISLTQVSYMIAVKRTSLLFATGYGYFMFKERHIRERLLGGIVMLIGLLFISTG